MRFAVLITYREVFGKEPGLEELRSLLRKYRRREVIAFLANLNCLLGTWRNAPEAGLDLQLSAYILARYRERLDAIRKSPHEHLVFSRLTILYLLKQACIACADEGPDLTSEPARNDLGICCLMANDLVLPFLPGPANSVLHKLANILPFSDYVSLDHYPMEIGRTEMIVEDILQIPQIRQRPDFLDVAKLFLDHFNIPPTTFCQMVFGCATKFLQITPQALQSSPESLVLRSNYFKNCRVAGEAVRDFLRSVAISEAELARRIQDSQNRPGDDLTLIQQFPLVEMMPDIYICLDAGFLVEKAGRGFYWALFSQASAELKAKLPGFWGAVFETYVNYAVQKSYGKNGRVIPEPRFANGDPSFDACILEGRDLIVFEHKSSVIRADAKYGGDVSKLEGELRLKFVEGEEGEPKGVTQLSRTLSRFFGGEAVADLECENISRVYPVLVCLESSVTVPYMARYFRERFDEIYPRKKFQQVVTPLFTLGISDVENLLGYLDSFKLSEILESYYGMNKTMMSSISSSIVPLLKNAQAGKNIVRDRFSQFADRMGKDLFGEDAGRVP